MLRRMMHRGPARTGALWVVALAVLGLTPVSSRAQLLPYSQSFEGMTQSDPGALGGDGWLVYGNVFTPANVYLYGYGPFPAPNGGAPGFCVLDTGQGGVSQGNLQLSVFNDYQNTAHANGDWVESNVYQERVINASDIGTWWTFEFDAKLGNLSGTSTALAFIKTLSPPTYALTNFLKYNTTAIPSSWNRYALSIPIEPGLAGQILQFGFASTATSYLPSGVFYDNITFSQFRTADVAPSAIARLQLSVRGNPAVGPTAQALSLSLPRSSRVSVRVFDLSGALVRSLLDRDLAAGVHQLTWHGEDASGRKVAPGLYLAVVDTGSERATAKLSRLQ